jgi:N-acetylglutamate synthase-like GNAT family acetyltransferase
LVYYRPVTLDDYDGVTALLEAAGWEARVLEESRLRRMISNADRTAGAFEEGTGALVGFAGALCDEAYSGYISTLCVHPGYRGRGIGTELVIQITEDSPEITWVLRAGAESPGFWEEHGFAPAQTAMEKARSR